MRICAISFHCCPFSLLGGDGAGGMSVYLRELCSATTYFPDVQIDIFTRIQNPNFRGAKSFSPQARVIHLKGGPEQRQDRTTLYKYLPEFASNLESFILKEREGYDLVYSHYWLSGLVGGRIKGKFSFPLVHAYHTLAFMKAKALGSPIKEHPSRLKSERQLAHVSDVIISSSHIEMKSLLEEYRIPAAKVKVIHPGVNDSLFFPSRDGFVPPQMRLRSGEKILLYVGRIDPIKGLMTVIETLELLQKSGDSLYEKLKFVIIGGGKKNQELLENKEYIRLRESIEKKKLKGKITFLGSIEQNQLYKYYSAADVLVVPSFYESFGLVALEALACGLPVIGSQIGGLRSLIREGKNGLFFRAGDPSNLARKLRFLFSQESRFWESEKIRKDVLRKFSWKRTAEETYSFLKKMI